MSQTSTKRLLAAAVADAKAFRALFPESAYAWWEVAGSVRRKKPEVGDVEHVIIPTFGRVMVECGGLFGPEPSSANLVWHRLDQLIDDPASGVTKHTYGETGNRWGPKYRGVDFRGYLHEIFMADPGSFGSTLAIRTGPAEFSKQMVTDIRRKGLCCEDGFVKYINGGHIYPVATEAAFFEACGMKWIPPEQRA